MSKIRTEISIESNESFVVRRRRYSIRTLCESCGRIAIFVRPTEAGFLSALDIATIVSLICCGELHVCDVPRRGIYLCLTSFCMRSHTADGHEDAGHVEEIGLLSGFDEHLLTTKIPE